MPGQVSHAFTLSQSKSHALDTQGPRVIIQSETVQYTDKMAIILEHSMA